MEQPELPAVLDLIVMKNYAVKGNLCSRERGDYFGESYIELNVISVGVAMSIGESVGISWFPTVFSKGMREKMRLVID